MSDLKNFWIPKLGTDPELFLMEKESKLPVPAEFFFPHQSRSREENRMVHFDNFAAEFETAPHFCLQTEIAEIGKGFLELYSTLEQSQIPIVPNLTAAIEIPQEVLRSSRAAMTFGCEPSTICTKGEMRVNRIQHPPTMRKRSIGFHVHLGHRYAQELDNPDKAVRGYRLLTDIDYIVKLVQNCDIFVGIPSVLLETDHEANKWRRQILGYGVAGEFRVQSYGIEYRTLPPWPLKHPVLAAMMMTLVRDAYFISQLYPNIYEQFDMAKVAEAINNCDKELAVDIWKQATKLLVEKIINPALLLELPNSTILLSYRRLHLFNAVLLCGGVDFLSRNLPVASDDPYITWRVSYMKDNLLYIRQGGYGSSLKNVLIKEIPGDLVFPYTYSNNHSFFEQTQKIKDERFFKILQEPLQFLPNP